MIKKRYATVLLVLSTLAFSTSAYAIVKYFSWETGVTVEVTEPKLAVYFDGDCTNPVNKIDFETIQAGARGKKVILYIRNEGEEDLTLTWRSTLSVETEGRMSDGWHDITDIPRELHEAWIHPNQVLTTQYSIYALPNTPQEKISWTLSLGVMW